MKWKWKFLLLSVDSTLLYHFTKSLLKSKFTATCINFVTDGAEIGTPIVTKFIHVAVNLLLSKDLVKWYNKLLSTDSKRNLHFHFISRLDHFVPKMTKVSDEFTNNAAIANGTIGNVKNIFTKS